MVRSTTEADDESFETITAPDAVEVGDTVDVSGPSFLPKSNLEVVEVDRSPARYEDAHGYENPTTFVARIPGRSNARDYCFLITDGGFVKTSGSSGVYDTAVTARVRHDAESKRVDVDVDHDEGDRVTVEYTHGLKDDDTGTVIGIHAREGTSDVTYVVDVDDGGRVYVTGDRLSAYDDPSGDTVVIRTDDGVIRATVDELIECDRVEDGARLGGTVDTDGPNVQYVDYHRADDVGEE
jgi:hypothetical protein